MASESLPRSVTLNGQRWTIYRPRKIAGTVDGVRGYRVLGKCYHHNRTILVRAWLPRRTAWKVLMHELLHALFPGAKEADVLEAEKVLWRYSKRISG